jgi:hypothetical protein
LKEKDGFLYRKKEVLKEKDGFYIEGQILKVLINLDRRKRSNARFHKV